MLSSRPLCFALVSLLLLAGCSATFHGFKCHEVPSAAAGWSPLLEEGDSPFEMSVEYGGQQFDGLLAVERSGDTLTVHLSSYVGLTVFAMQRKGGKWRMMSSLPPLRRRGVAHLLGRDFEMLFSSGKSVMRRTAYTCPDTLFVVHAPKVLRGRYWVHGQEVDTVRYGSCMTKGVIRRMPQKAVRVEHPAVGFTYTIKPLP